MKITTIIFMMMILAATFVDGKIEKCRPQAVMISGCRKFYKTTIGYKDGAAIFQLNETFNSFKPLIHTKCSAQLELLLCTINLPICDPNINVVVRPCKSMCLKVKHECRAFYTLSNKKWPEELDCDKLTDDTTTTMRNKILCVGKPTVKVIQKISHKKVTKSKFSQSSCYNYKNWQNYIFIERTNRCALKCLKNAIFNNQEKRVSQLWISVLAVITLLSTSFTCVAFLFTKPIKYPQQTLVFVAFCYFIYSVSILLRIMLGRTKLSCDFDPISGEKILIQEGLENTSCALTFLLNFFFTTASHLWWLVIMFSWLLSTGFGISAKKLCENSGYMHLVVWFTTSLLTIAVLIKRTVDADELLGLCYVGGQNPGVLLQFSIIPKTVCLVYGVVFFISGYILGRRRNKLSLVKSRSYLHNINYNNKNNNGINKILTNKNDSRNPEILSLIPYSITYIITIVALIFCEFYEYFNYPQWLSGQQNPIFEVFLLKIFVNQINGIQSLIWICYVDTGFSLKQIIDKIKGKVVNKSEILSYEYDGDTNNVEDGVDNSNKQEEENFPEEEEEEVKENINNKECGSITDVLYGNNDPNVKVTIGE